ncbi:MAG: hypothetical protein IPM26_17150 [Saprospiraceae bacterium]|nr:hypothetical protein [Saprospiraceae bacterium]
MSPHNNYRYLVLLIILGAGQVLSGQFGLRLKYNDARFSNWENALQRNFNVNNSLYSPMYEIGADYWFRLKKKRIEFMPELSYAMAKTNYETTSLDAMKYSSINFNFHTHIYALDMDNDCNCPTFSKQGPGINKGLFFHFTPGVSMANAEAVLRPESSVALPENKSNAVLLRAGVGLGLDIGVSDLMTVTPIISYYFQSGMVWNDLLINGSSPGDVHRQSHAWEISLRLGFRPDYNKRSYRDKVL